MEKGVLIFQLVSLSSCLVNFRAISSMTMYYIFDCIPNEQQNWDVKPFWNCHLGGVYKWFFNSFKETCLDMHGSNGFIVLSDTDFFSVTIWWLLTIVIANFIVSWYISGKVFWCEWEWKNHLINLSCDDIFEVFSKHFEIQDKTLISDNIFFLNIIQYVRGECRRFI